MIKNQLCLLLDYKMGEFVLPFLFEFELLSKTKGFMATRQASFQD